MVENVITSVTGTATYLDGLQKLGMVPQLSYRVPTMEEMALLRVKYGICWDDLDEFVWDFGLPRHFTVHRVRTVERAMTAGWTVLMSPDGTGFFVDVSAEVGSLLMNLDITQRVSLKISFDGCQICRTGRSPLQIGTVSAPEFGSVEKAMSPDGAHILWVAAVAEKSSTYESALEGLAGSVQELLTGTMEFVDEKNKKIDYHGVLVLDMKAACMFLGLMQVYKANARCRCLYCLAKSEDLTQSVLVKPLRMTDTVNQARDNLTEGLKAIGFKTKPLLYLPPNCTILSVCPPDLLHIILRVVDKLLSNSLEFVSLQDNDVANELVAFFKDECGVNVFDSVKVNDKSVKELKLRVHKSPWRRESCLRLVVARAKFLEILQKIEQFTVNKEMYGHAVQMWNSTATLFDILMRDWVSVDVELDRDELNQAKTTFIAEGKALLSSVVALNGSGGVTTYIHVLVVHCVDLLGVISFPRFSNYDIEGKNLKVKRFKKSPQGTKDFEKQVLKCDKFSREPAVQKKKKKAKAKDNKPRKKRLYHEELPGHDAQ